MELLTALWLLGQLDDEQLEHLGNVTADHVNTTSEHLKVTASATNEQIPGRSKHNKQTPPSVEMQQKQCDRTVVVVCHGFDRLAHEVGSLCSGLGTEIVAFGSIKAAMHAYLGTDFQPRHHFA